MARMGTAARPNARLVKPSVCVEIKLTADGGGADVRHRAGLSPVIA
jgi:hypothetical protein